MNTGDSSFEPLPGGVLAVCHQKDHCIYAFFCPGCDRIHQFRVGRQRDWTFDGNEQVPTFKPSLLVTGVKDAEFDATPARCHSFVTAGKIRYLADCTHAMKGGTVDMVPIPEGKL